MTICFSMYAFNLQQADPNHHQVEPKPDGHGWEDCIQKTLFPGVKTPKAGKPTNQWRVEVTEKSKQKLPNKTTSMSFAILDAGL